MIDFQVTELVCMSVFFAEPVRFPENDDMHHGNPGYRQDGCSNCETIPNAPFHPTLASQDESKNHDADGKAEAHPDSGQSVGHFPPCLYIIICRRLRPDRTVGELIRNIVKI